MISLALGDHAQDLLLAHEQVSQRCVDRATSRFGQSHEYAAPVRLVRQAFDESARGQAVDAVRAGTVEAIQPQWVCGG